MGIVTTGNSNEAAMRAEVKIRLREALNTLDPLDREVLALQHFEQLSPAETAAVLGITEGRRHALCPGPPAPRGAPDEAVQESLGRHVALKVLPFQSLADGHHLERFRREARAAAKLHHTNIVPVFGVGEHAGVHYFAMQFIRGQGLDSVLHELNSRRRT